jgi:hypothetical protein
MAHFKRQNATLSVITACALQAACGGGSSDENIVANNPTPTPVPTPTPTPAPAETTFPTGLAVASPADLDSAPAAGVGRFRIASAAAPGDRLELKTLSAQVEKVLKGDSSVDLEDVLNLGKLFSNSGNANCYGPSMKYDSHEDAPPAGLASGTLPGGDLGLWTELDAGGDPCVASQLNARTAGIKGQTMQGLLLMAVLRHTVTSTSGLSMPTAGSTTDLTSQFESRVRAFPPFSSWDVHSATISLNSGGTAYTYRLALTNGESGAQARLGEVIMRHVPGTSAASYEGLMHVAGFALSNDSAFGCDDEKDTTANLFKVAHVSTLAYERSDTAVSFGSRSASYCGHPASTGSSDYGAEVASYNSGGELDPTVELAPGQPRNRGTSKGWIAGFTRFAGDFNVETAGGDFLYAWQAGTGDDKSRMLAVDTSYDVATLTHTLRGYFGFAADISTTDGALLGMICNWAGPGNNHTPAAKFQSQRATLVGDATVFTVPSGGSKILYAPTNSCSSTTTSYDVNVDNTLAANEGVGTVAALDEPSGSNSVQQEIESRGFAKPTAF